VILKIFDGIGRAVESEGILGGIGVSKIVPTLTSIQNLRKETGME
jgi:hypothetical protein